LVTVIHVSSDTNNAHHDDEQNKYSSRTVSNEIHP